MKYIYVVDEHVPYHSHVVGVDPNQTIVEYTGDAILTLMGDTAVLNAVYELLIQNGEIKPGDILAPERNGTD